MNSCCSFRSTLKVLAVVGVVSALSATTLAQSLDKGGKKAPQPAPKKIVPPASKPINPSGVDNQVTRNVKGQVTPGAKLSSPTKAAADRNAPRGAGNDECTAPVALSGSPATSAYNNGAATTGGHSQANAICLFFSQTGIANDEWFLWTANATGTATASTCGGTGDTKIAAYSGATCPPGAPIACNDDACGLLTTTSFAVTAGAQYLLQLGTYPGGANGVGTLTITGPAAGCPGPANNCCATATPIGDGTTSFDPTGATTDGPTNCANQVNDVWFDYTASCTGSAVATTCSGGVAAYDSVVSVYDGTACTGTLLGCDDDGGACPAPAGFSGSAVTFAVVAGNHYRVQVGAFNGPSGALAPSQITMSCTGGGGGPANDNCANATPIGDGTTPFNPVGATTDGLSNCAPQVNDVWFDYTASCTGDASATTCLGGAAAYDSVVSVYDGTACVGTLLACDDDGGGCPAPLGFSGSRAAFSVVAGNHYRIQVGAYNGPSGALAPSQITVSCAQPVPPVCLAYNPPTDCQCPSLDDGYNCTNFALAEDITSNVPVTSVCINAIYFGNAIVPDAWVLTFLEDNGGRPDCTQVIDTFTQGTDMIVTGPADTGMDTFGRNVYEWNMILARPVAAPTNRCVWMQMQNFASGDSVFVQTANCNGDGQTAQDLDLDGCYGPADVQPFDVAICINGGFRNNLLCFQDPCVGMTPTNDDCANAVALAANGIPVHGTTTCAGTDGTLSCSGIPNNADVWYTVTGSGNTLSVDFCASAFYDTSVEIYSGTCGAFNCVIGNDDFCGLQSGASWCSNPGEVYYVNVHGFFGASGEFDITANDDGILCVPCTTITCPNDSIAENEVCMGDSNGGCNAPVPPAYEAVTCNATVCGTSFLSLALNLRDTDWYSVVAPASGTISATITSDFPADIFILDVPTCTTIGLLASAANAPCATSTVTATVTPGTTYIVFVSPSLGLGDTVCPGTYYIAFDIGVPCPTGVPCCDFNNDGTINSQDFFDFLVAFFGSLPASDFNGDGILNSQDFFDFIVCFFSPPVGCP